MVERIRNVNKADKKKNRCTAAENDELPTPKRGRKAKSDELTRRYPIPIGSTQPVDYESFEQHCKAIKEEMDKPKPRDRVLLPLMKSTFAARWLFVKNDAESVKEILENYPCLKLPAIVSGCHTQNIKFCDSHVGMWLVHRYTHNYVLCD